MCEQAPEWRAYRRGRLTNMSNTRRPHRTSSMCSVESAQGTLAARFQNATQRASNKKYQKQTKTQFGFIVSMESRSQVTLDSHLALLFRTSLAAVTAFKSMPKLHASWMSWWALRSAQCITVRLPGHCAAQRALQMVVCVWTFFTAE